MLWYVIDRVPADGLVSCWVWAQYWGGGQESYTSLWNVVRLGDDKFMDLALVIFPMPLQSSYLNVEVAYTSKPFYYSIAILQVPNKVSWQV